MGFQQQCGSRSKSIRSKPPPVLLYPPAHSLGLAGASSPTAKGMGVGDAGGGIASLKYFLRH